MADLNKIVYLRQDQYNSLINGTLTGHTFDINTLYITDEAGDATTVNGHTVQTDVPANAVFTDTNKYHTSGSWSNLTYTATAINGAEALTFTIPTGSTAATVAVGNHNHNGTYIKTTSSTENAIVRFNDNNGEVKTSIVTIGDNGDISINAAASGAPSLTLQRGTTSDAYTDWKIVDTGGKLSFQSRSNSATWTERASFADNSGNFTATSFIGNGSALTSLNGSNISSGTVALARLPMGAADTALTGTSTSTAPQYTSINTTLTNTNATGDNTQKLQVTVLGVDSSQVSLGKASTSVYGVTKLSVAADNSNLAATAKSVYDLGETINGLLAAADAMVFKGTLGTGGTVTTLPTSKYQAGWTYKVITENDYGNSSLHLNCEVGDLIIAIKDGPASGSSVIPADWTVVQTNLEGAVTTLDGATGYLAKFNGNTSITKGPQIGTGTTKFLREDGTWQTPSYTTNTDEKVKVAALTSGTTYYPILATGTGTATRQVDTTLKGLSYISTAGTTSAVGTAILTLGNNTAKGSANNEQGVLRLYGTTAYYVDMKMEDGLPAANRTMYLPSYAGTMYMVAATTTDAVGSTTKPIYINNIGAIQEGNELKDLAYIAKPSSNTTTTWLRGDGTWIAPPNDDTHHTAYLYAGANDATAHAARTAGNNIYLCLRENNTQRSTVQIKQGSNMTISSDANGVITFASSYTNTDTLVKQTSKTDDVKYKLLASAQASPTSGAAYEAIYDTKVYINPSLNTINAGGLVVHDKAATPVEKVTLQWNTTDLALEFVFA